MGKISKSITTFCHLLLISVAIFIISLIPKEVAWLEHSLLLMACSAALADILMLLLDKYNKISLAGAKLLTYLGFLLLAIFAVWILAILFWFLNLLFSWLGSDFRLEEIYSGHLLVVFSLPALLSGFFLLAMGKMWEAEYYDEKNNKGKVKRAFR